MRAASSSRTRTNTDATMIPAPAPLRSTNPRRSDAWAYEACGISRRPSWISMEDEINTKREYRWNRTAFADCGCESPLIDGLNGSFVESEGLRTLGRTRIWGI